MADYKKMHFSLFNKITDVIEELQEIQQKTEEIFIGTDESLKKGTALKAVPFFI